jgi:RNA polymerase sigma factor (sigma-70 family)
MPVEVQPMASIRETVTSRTMMAAVVIGTALAGTTEITATPSPAPAALDDISKYCNACWRNARLPVDRWSDATQQVFIRLLERVPQQAWSRVLVDSETTERKEFVRAIDTVKKRTQRTKTYADYPMDAGDHRIDNTLTDRRAAIDEIAPRVLSGRQQRIVELSFNGWAVPEIAAELGTTVQRVSDEKYKAIQKLKASVTAD